jgi:hypothetical protein
VLALFAEFPKILFIKTQHADWSHLAEINPVPNFVITYNPELPSYREHREVLSTWKPSITISAKFLWRGVNVVPIASHGMVYILSLASLLL